MFMATFTWSTLWLILHIMSAILAFGPPAAYGILTSLGEKQPEHRAFSVLAILEIEKKLALPMSIVLPFFGTALIVTKRYDLWKSEWLLFAIPIYIVAFFFAVFVEDRWGAKAYEMQKALPVGQDPPPELASLLKKLQIGGAFLGIVVLVMVVLMVWKPGAAFLPPK